MAMDQPRTELETELREAVEDLHAALERAADATGSIKALLPRVGTIGGLLDELDAVVRSGRRQIGIVPLEDAA